MSNIIISSSSTPHITMTQLTPPVLSIVPSSGSITTKIPTTTMNSKKKLPRFFFPFFFLFSYCFSKIYLFSFYDYFNHFNDHKQDHHDHHLDTASLKVSFFFFHFSCFILLKQYLQLEPPLSQWQMPNFYTHTRMNSARDALHLMHKGFFLILSY